MGILLLNRHDLGMKWYRVLMAILIIASILEVGQTIYMLVNLDAFLVDDNNLLYTLLVTIADIGLRLLIFRSMLEYDEKVLKLIIVFLAFSLLACCVTYWLLTVNYYVLNAASSFGPFFTRCIIYIPSYFYLRNRLVFRSRTISQPQTQPQHVRFKKCAQCDNLISYPECEKEILCSVCRARVNALSMIANDIPETMPAEFHEDEMLPDTTDKVPTSPNETKTRPSYCRKCGSKLHMDSLYCENCGEKVIFTEE